MDTSRTSKRLQIFLACIIALLPLHATITTWAASNFGHFDLLRIWKELLLLPIGLVALSIAYRQKRLKPIFNLRYIQLMCLYAVLSLVLGVWALRSNRVDSDALIYAFIINLRFFAIFTLAILVGSQPFITAHWKKIILIPAAVVVTFGLMQQFILPPDWLRHVGYGSDTIQTYQTVDQKSDYVRLQSTLRGPNPFGVYLSLILLACVSLFLRAKQHKYYYLVAIIAVAGVLGGTYSRSAWIGSICGLGLLLWLQIKSRKTRRLLVIMLLVAGLLVGMGVWVYRNNSVLKNTLLHTDDTSTSPESSNAVRRQAIRQGAEDVLREPLGRGPGTAGPASVRNPYSRRIAENYYLQIGQEVGVLGMSMFIAINGFVAYLLWLNRKDQLTLILLVSFVAITIANMLSHAWADDTISLLWWGLAGFAVERGIINQDTSINNKNVTKKYSKTN